MNEFKNPKKKPIKLHEINDIFEYIFKDRIAINVIKVFIKPTIKNFKNCIPGNFIFF